MGRTSNAREDIIKAAISLFYSNSYNAIGVQQICKTADVKKGSFYYFFESKQALALEVLDTLWANYEARFLKPLLENDAMPISERIYQLFEQTYQHASAHQDPIQGCRFGNLAVELSTQDDIIRDKLEAIFQTWTVMIAATLQRAIDTGDLSTTIDADTTAETIMALFEGGAVMSKAYNNAAIMQRLGKQAVQLLSSTAT